MQLDLADGPTPPPGADIALRFILVTITAPAHWALLIMARLRGVWHGFLADGLKLQETSAMVADYWGRICASSANQFFMDSAETLHVPEQTDAWTCGLRLIQCVHHVANIWHRWPGQRINSEMSGAWTFADCMTTATRLEAAKVNMDPACVVDVQSSDDEEQPPTDDKEQPPSKRPRVDGPAQRGRPKRGQSTFNLTSWLSQNRAKLYMVLPSPPGCDSKRLYKCLQCGASVDAVRDSTNFFILQHEKGQRHQDSSGRDAMVVTEPSAEKALCGGITLKQAQMLHLPIGSISESVVFWATSGAICSGRSVMDSWWRRQGDIILRAHQCAADAEAAKPRKVGSGCVACRECSELGQQRRLAQSIALWTFRIDLVNLAHKRLYEEAPAVTEHITKMQQRDYVRTDMVSQGECEKWVNMPVLVLVQQLRLQLLSIPADARSASLQMFLETRVATLPAGTRCLSTSDQAKTLMMRRYAMEVASGDIIPDDVKVGMKIASGALRGKGLAAQRVLVSHLVGMADRLKRDRCTRIHRALPASGRREDPVAIVEAGFLVASSTPETRQAFLPLFGVNPRGANGKLKLTNDLLPDPWGALTDHPRVVRNTKCGLQHCQGLGARWRELVFDASVFCQTHDLVHGYRRSELPCSPPLRIRVRGLGGGGGEGGGRG